MVTPVWSPDGSKLSYEYDEERNGYWNYFIGIYDLRNGAATTLVNETNEPFVDEYDVSWSSDGTRLLSSDTREVLTMSGSRTLHPEHLFRRQPI